MSGTSGMIYIHGNLTPPEEEFRNLQSQLADPVVTLEEKVVYAGDLVVPASGTEIDIFISAKVPSSRSRLRSVHMVTTTDVASTAQGYWTVSPKVLNSFRGIIRAAEPKDSRSSRFLAHKLVSWEDVDVDLAEGGGVLFRFTWAGTPPTLTGLCLACVVEKGVL